MNKIQEWELKVKGITYEELDDTIIDVYTFCASHVSRDPVAILDCLHPSVKDQLTQEDRELIKNGPPPDPTQSWDKLSPEDQLTIARSIFNEQIMWGKMKGTGSSNLCEIKDKDLKILKLVDDDNSSLFLESVLARGAYNALGRVLHPAEVSTMTKLWKMHSYLDADSFVPHRLPEDPGWCLHRCLTIPDSNIKFPRWQSFLDRLSDPDAFCAWYWGSYTRQYTGRRVMWLYGKTSEDGKSTLTDMLGMAMFGDTMGVVNNTQIKNSRFFISFVGDAPMIMYPDANNGRALWSEVMKAVASYGAEGTISEKKGAQAKFVKMKSRVCVTANIPPVLEYNDAQLSRLLIVEIQPMTEKGDASVLEEYEAELPGFFAHCKSMWERKSSHGGSEIETNQATKDLLDSIQVQESGEFLDIIHESFIIDDGEEIDYKDVTRILKAHGLSGAKDGENIPAFITFLERCYGIKKVRDNSRHLQMFKGMGRKGATKNKVASITKNSKWGGGSK